VKVGSGAHVSTKGWGGLTLLPSWIRSIIIDIHKGKQESFSSAHSYHCQLGNPTLIAWLLGKHGKLLPLMRMIIIVVRVVVCMYILTYRYCIHCTTLYHYYHTCCSFLYYIYAQVIYSFTYTSIETFMKLFVDFLIVLCFNCKHWKQGNKDKINLNKRLTILKSCYKVETQ